MVDQLVTYVHTLEAYYAFAFAFAIVLLFFLHGICWPAGSKEIFFHLFPIRFALPATQFMENSRTNKLTYPTYKHACLQFRPPKGEIENRKA